ncbi:hypothetical protein QTI66_33725 [Variovorax sp. J22R133]|uniref:hypothetical protein n=1 Tax=Variovorax brevis TaxID=3053503 RepID=UPI002575DA7B|nr:hypothetical protein [Variovorax sp. J22R133]MDM0117084.1 hypothetical protein [Variovorax sp. J22R133]
MKATRISLALVMAWLLAVSACAQIAAPKPPAADCPASAKDLPMQALYGTWDATFDGVPGIATVVLEKHPDYDGVRGTIQRAGKPPARLAGDIDTDGLLALDESQDGQSIDASWSGDTTPGTCGKEFKGTWRKASDDSTRPFVLRKTGQWN